MTFEGVTAEPGDRAPAPGPLRLVQQFVNTVDLEGGPERLPDARALKEWLISADLLEPRARVTDGDHRRAIALREAIRELATGHAGHDHDPHAAATVDATARRAGLHPVLGESTRLEPAARGVDAALGRIVAAIHAAVVEGTWPRLKACDRHACRWAFYDRSKNRSGQWCSMAVCGSREKNRRAYRRRVNRGSG